MVTPTQHLQDVARAYDDATHLDTPLSVTLAYRHLCSELLTQFHALPFPVIFTDEDPYPDADTMFRDIDMRGHLRVWRSAHLPCGHPFAWRASNGESFNCIFRAVHDGYAHYARRHPFGIVGEHAAYREHARTLTLLSAWALFTETEGQNAAGHFGQSAPDYAPQKATLLPFHLFKQSLTL